MVFNDTFLRACRKEAVDHVPVWYMRQAGRTDPDYRKIKEKYSLLEICGIPELAAEVTMMPVKKHNVDAAILYSDIMNPIASIGIEFDIVKNIGPVIHDPIRSRQDVEKLRPFDAERDLSHVLETIKILDRELKVPLITFAGAPFTLASYIIEGRSSRNYLKTKELMYSDPDTWHLLMNKLGDMVIGYFKAQVEAGAKALQLFDSWVGALSVHDFREYVLPVITRIFAEVAHLPQPKIYFPGVSSGHLIAELQKLQVDVVGLDWRVDIRNARTLLNNRFAVQGNLDPTVLTAPMPVIKQYAKQIIDQGIEQPGYIFNLGHGLFPEASLEKIQELTAYVHEYSREALKQSVKGSEG